MKRIYALLISLFFTGIVIGQTVTEVMIPRYINGGYAGASPYAYRATIDGLTPNATYRFINTFVFASDLTNNEVGLGFCIFVKQSGAFVRTDEPRLDVSGHYGEFTTDGNGVYTGWFISEQPASFFPTDVVYPKFILNNGAGGTTAAIQISAANSAVTVIGFGTFPEEGTALRSTPATFGTAKNFVMLYDNAAGTGRPVAGTFIEGDGTDNSSYAEFYAGGIDERDKTWAANIPNMLPNGIQKIVQYSLADGVRVGSSTSSTGVWAKAGGGTVSTINPDGSDTLALDGMVVALNPPVAQTITFDNLTPKTYGDDEFLPGATASSTLYGSSNTSVADTVRISGQLYIVIKGAGTTDLTATQPGNDNFGVAPPVTRTLTVNKANLTIKADDKQWLQGTTMPELTVTYTGFVNGDNSDDLAPKPTVTTTATGTSPVGEYEITVSGAASPNYNIDQQPGTIEIVSNTQSQTIDFSPIPDKVYGAAPIDPGATASSTLPVIYSSSDISVADTLRINNRLHLVIKGTGTTTITASQPGNGTFDPAPEVSQTLTVTKAALTIRADNKTRLFGQPNPPLTIVYSGFVYGENNTHLLTQPVITTTAILTSAPGVYPIEVKDAASDNYEITYENGELTVDPLPAQTITFRELPVKKYGDPKFEPDAETSSGLTVIYTSSNTNVAIIEDDTLVVIVGAGTTVITASQPGDATHAPAPDVTKTLTVQKVPLTVRATDKSKNEGQPNPPLTVTYIGFVNGDDAGKLNTQPVMNTIATTTSVAGAYNITIQGATSSNYTINHQPGILSVLPAQGEGQDNVNAYISGPGQLRVNVHVVNTAKIAIQIFDIHGSRLVNTTVTPVKGFNTYQIPIGHLAPGIYNVRVAGSEVMLKTKIVIP
jgi:hypothetical protein